MGIKSTNHLDTLPQPLSKIEIKNFERNTTGRIVITVSAFRLDLAQSRTSPFNQEAVRVAAEDLIMKVTHDKWYRHPSIPSHYLEQCYVEMLMLKHLKYLKELYIRNNGQDQIRLQAAARSSQKTRVCDTLSY